MTEHPFRFGVVAGRAESAATWAETAQRVEALGYATLLMPDTIEYSPSPMVALAAAAMATTRLRVGTYVIANDYRHPVLLAKEAATLDLLSAGRFELGIGAGRPSAAADYRMLGVPFTSGGTRIARLAESIAVIKGLLAGETVSTSEGSYTIEDARITPRPDQQPLPILVAGSGRRLLSLAAQTADIVALGVSPDASEEDVAEKIGWLHEAAGERFATLELNINLMAVGGRMVRYVAAQFGDRAAALANSDAIPILSGSVDQMCEQLLRRRETLGISYIAVGQELVEELAPVVERLAGR